MRGDRGQVIRRDRLETWLMRSWWVLFPSFTALTVRLAVERACADPYDLLPALTSHPGWVWSVALVYVFAHLWVLSAYLVTVSRVQEVLPGVSGFRAVWGAGALKLLLMVGILAMEYSPSIVWRPMATVLRCRL
jgi:hypothetical protein